MKRVYCTKCGKANDPAYAYCTKCGARLDHEAQAAAGIHNKRLKKLLVCLFLLVLLLGGSLGWGCFYYSRDQQVTRMVLALRDPQKDLSPYIHCDDPEFDVIPSTVRPLQVYYQHYQKQLGELNLELRQAGYQPDPQDLVSLKQEGKYFFIFPRYQLTVKTHDPVFQTSFAPYSLFINGFNSKTMDKKAQKYGEPLIEGRYAFKAVGQKQQAQKTVDLLTDDPVKLPASAKESSAQKKARIMAQNRSNNTSDVPTETLGVMVALLQKKSANWLKGSLKQGQPIYYELVRSEKIAGKPLLGYNALLAKDRQTALLYRVQGQQVTYLWREKGKSDPLKTVSVARLKHNYYRNKDQRGEVDDYVSQLKTSD